MRDRPSDRDRRERPETKDRELDVNQELSALGFRSSPDCAPSAALAGGPGGEKHSPRARAVEVGLVGVFGPRGRDRTEGGRALPVSEMIETRALESSVADQTTA